MEQQDAIIYVCIVLCLYGSAMIVVVLLALLARCEIRGRIRFLLAMMASACQSVGIATNFAAHYTGVP